MQRFKRNRFKFGHVLILAYCIIRLQEEVFLKLLPMFTALLYDKVHKHLNKDF